MIHTVCLICGKILEEDCNDNQICDRCEEAREELSNGYGGE